jgi:hypothetical protein
MQAFFQETTLVPSFGKPCFPHLVSNIDSSFCSNGKMFYGIYGDTDGDSPQVIGEASWLMARTCFPNDDLNGNSGHGAVDVTCESNTLLSFFHIPLLTC